MAREISNLSDKRNELKAAWVTEKGMIEKMREKKEMIESMKMQADQAERSGDYGKSQNSGTELLPTLKRRFTGIKMKLNKTIGSDPY